MSNGFYRDLLIKLPDASENSKIKLIQEMFAILCDKEEHRITLRILKITNEKRELLGLSKAYLFPMIFLSMDNPYRDSFYKLFIEHKFNDQDAINKFALLITDIMQPYNNESLFNRYPHHVGVLNSILAIFNFLPINLSEKIDAHGFKNEHIVYRNFNSDILKYIKRYFEKLIKSDQPQQFQSIKQMQPVLKSLFGHYKLINNAL